MASPSKSKVYFFFDGVKFGLKNRINLKKFIERIFRVEKQELALIHYIFTSDVELLKLNKNYLGHNTLTDILTFDLSEAGGNGIQAEVYISIDRVHENAKDFKTSFDQELARVVFHGALHLCGFGDSTKAEKQRMRSKENEWLRRWDRST